MISLPEGFAEELEPSDPFFYDSFFSDESERCQHDIRAEKGNESQRMKPTLDELNYTRHGEGCAPCCWACIRNRVVEWNRQRWAEISSCDVVQGALGFGVCCKKGSCSLCSMLFVNPS